jgi:hypothetical protein
MDQKLQVNKKNCHIMAVSWQFGKSLTVTARMDQISYDKLMDLDFAACRKESRL